MRPGRRLLIPGILLATAGIAILTAAPAFARLAASTARGPLTVVAIDAGCVPGGVGGAVTVANLSDSDLVDDIPLRLMQHIPPSQGGPPDFTPVAGGGIVVHVEVPAGGQVTAPFGPVSLANVSPLANALRVDTDTDLRPDLNPEKSDSFPPCGGATPTASATGTPAATRTPSVTAVATGTPTAAVTGTHTVTASATTPSTPGTSTATPAASVTASVTATPSAVTTPSPSASVAITPSPSVTITPAPSITTTPSPSVTVTASPPATDTATQTAAATATSAASVTTTPSPSPTASVTPAPSPSPAPPRAASATPSPTPVAGASPSPTRTVVGRVLSPTPTLVDVTLPIVRPTPAAFRPRLPSAGVRSSVGSARVWPWFVIGAAMTVAGSALVGGALGHRQRLAADAMVHVAIAGLRDFDEFYRTFLAFRRYAPAGEVTALSYVLSDRRAELRLDGVHGDEHALLDAMRRSNTRRSRVERVEPDLVVIAID